MQAGGDGVPVGEVVAQGGGRGVDLVDWWKYLLMRRWAVVCRASSAIASRE